jgi:peroxiredoxin
LNAGAWTAIGVAIAAAIVTPMFLSGRSTPSGPSGLAGSTAPVFALRDDRGARASLDAYRGKIVVMNLWASWCPPCRAEMPDLQRFEAAYKRYGIVVVGVNEGESAQRARAFADSLKITFPIWVDSDQQYGRIYAALGMPTTVVIGADGIVKKGFDGPLTYLQMEAAVKPYIRNT